MCYFLCSSMQASKKMRQKLLGIINYNPLISQPLSSYYKNMNYSHPHPLQFVINDYWEIISTKSPKK